MPKRTRSRSRGPPTRYSARLAQRARPAKKIRVNVAALQRGLSRINRMIETKEATWTSNTNVNLPHNNTYVVQTVLGVLNPLRCTNGSDDPMGTNGGSRIGDAIALKGLRICMFLENSLQRAKVFFRVMLVKCPRGVTPDRASVLFKGCSANKMIDTVNTEKFSILWQRRFTIDTSNNAAATVGATGVPATGTTAGIGTKVVTGWVPGRKFGRNGVVTYEDASSTNPKFFDYRIVILCYDWFGTPQDVNNVGVLNELYTKMYFKDA